MKERISMNESVKHEKVYNDAVELVKRIQQCNLSILQRQLRIGAPRALRLLDELEENGIISPRHDDGKRDVLVEVCRTLANT